MSKKPETLPAVQQKAEALFGEARARFINRELSWLSFNSRVMEEAASVLNPLLERLKFLSISASNLDEFFMVRVAGLKYHVRHGITTTSDDGLTPKEQLKKIHSAAEKLIHAQQRCWLQLRKELKGAGIEVLTREQLSAKEARWLGEYFQENLFPVLTPIAIDPAHPFPFLPNLGQAQIFRLALPRGKGEQVAVVPFPASLKRFIALPGKKQRFIALEEVIELCVGELFPGMQRLDSGIFRVVRDSDLAIEEEAEDLVRYFERAVKRRRRGGVIRVKFAGPVSAQITDFVATQLAIDPQDIFEVEGMLGLQSLLELYDAGPAELKFAPFNPRYPERIDDYEGNCFAAIRAKDLVIHHPFESFDVVVRFLEQAAEDPDVVSIKQTLYRTSKDSPIVRALIAAAEAGKSVTALVELKARFDEEANIKWARDLERAGAQVVYGFVNLKTHAKVSLVVRKEEGKLRSYAHFGTGNYHPNTARLYTDLSFFTCDADLCRDAAQLFNFVTGYAEPAHMRKLVMAPLHMRHTLVELIDAEIAHARAGRPAAVWAKMNALVDPDIIDALYRASMAGVTVELVVRGICCLRPGVKGLSDHISVKSIVGRFLEHARIFCFGSGSILPSPNAKLFISSADWMPRNLDWRVEDMVPIENPTVHEQIMGRILVANLNDEQQSWLLGPDGAYTRMPPGPQAFSAHEYFMRNPSLSGRGKALKKSKTVAASPVYRPQKRK